MRVLAFLAGVTFGIGAIFQVVNGPDLDKAAAFVFWLLVGLCLAAFEVAFGGRIVMPTRRR
jgi:hypothetical protein